MTPLELEEMTRELREARPTLDSKVSAELDDWAAAGFPRRDQQSRSETKSPTKSGRKRNKGWMVPAFGGGFALLLVALVAGLSQTTQVDSGDDSAIIDTEPATPQPTSPDSGLKEESASAGATSIQSDIAPDDRVQNRDTGLTLTADEDEVDDVTGDAALVVQQYDGIVDEQTVSSGGSRDARGFIAARIPVQNLDVAVAEISDLADVKAMNQALTDITKGFVTAEKRFATAQARVDSLLEQLSVSDDPTLREQLRVARLQLASARADLRAQKQEGNYADLTLGIVGEDGGWSIGDAADDAVGIFEWIGGALLVSLAVLIPAVALGAALWFGTRSLRRRRRESVLDE